MASAGCVHGPKSGDPWSKLAGQEPHPEHSHERRQQALRLQSVRSGLRLPQEPGRRQRLAQRRARPAEPVELGGADAQRRGGRQAHPGTQDRPVLARAERPRTESDDPGARSAEDDAVDAARHERPHGGPGQRLHAAAYAGTRIPRRARAGARTRTRGAAARRSGAGARPRQGRCWRGGRRGRGRRSPAVVGALTQQFQQIASSALQDAAQLKVPTMADAAGMGAGPISGKSAARPAAAAAKKATPARRGAAAAKRPAPARKRAS